MDQVNAQMQKGEHHLLLTWLTLISVISFALFVAWRENVILLLYLSDSSKLSWAITLLFLIITLYCARRTYLVSREINASNQVCASIRRDKHPAISIRHGNVYISDDIKLPDCLLTGYLLDLYYQAGSRLNNSELIDVFEAKLKNPHNIGWFFTDIMIKLGLLGTIIGFVLMLGSVVNVTDFDVSTMQNILRQMSSGMGTALYTTFAGLVCSILTAAQFHMLDQAADELIDATKHLTQVHILPNLASP